MEGDREATINSYQTTALKGQGLPCL